MKRLPLLGLILALAAGCGSSIENNDQALACYDTGSGLKCVPLEELPANTSPMCIDTDGVTDVSQSSASGPSADDNDASVSSDSPGLLLTDGDDDDGDDDDGDGDDSASTEDPSGNSVSAEENCGGATTQTEGDDSNSNEDGNGDGYSDSSSDADADGTSDAQDCDCLDPDTPTNTPPNPTGEGGGPIIL